MARSSYYYEVATETPENLRLMELIDREYTDHPFVGSRRMVVVLNGKTDPTTGEQYEVNRKRVQRLMRLMGIEAVYPKPKLSARGEGHKVYPYLLRGVEIARKNQVWSTDITYVPMPSGFLYLTAVIDWYSRYVLSWRLSNTRDSDFCIEALEAALKCGVTAFPAQVRLRVACSLRRVADADACVRHRIVAATDETLRLRPTHSHTVRSASLARLPTSNACRLAPSDP